MNNDTYRPIVEKELIETLGFYIEPDYLFSNLIKSIETQTFQIEDLSTAIKMSKILHVDMTVKMISFTYSMIWT